VKIVNVEVGLFRLPGVVLEQSELTEEITQEINTWCTQNNCGKQMTSVMWSFKKETQRDMFILKWSS
jgi:hypothetical protein